MAFGDSEVAEKVTLPPRAGDRVTATIKISTVTREQTATRRGLRTCAPRPPVAPDVAAQVPPYWRLTLHGGERIVSGHGNRRPATATSRGGDGTA